MVFSGKYTFIMPVFVSKFPYPLNNKWKRGFYHIVKNAGIPIVMAKVDGRQKMTHVGQVFHLTEDAEADIQSIQEAFAGLEGINPKRKSKKKYITLEE
jgi:hypothetical protein